MGWIKDKIENVTEAVDAFAFIAKRAAQKPWSRVLLMAVVGILVMGGPLYYVNTLVEEYGKSTDEFLAENNRFDKENRAQRALDYINVCIEAGKGVDANKDYYCQSAIDAYKDVFYKDMNKNVEEKIKRSAYGAMKVEVATKVRMATLERIDQKKPELNGKLAFMLSTPGIALICLAGVFAMLLTALATYNLSNQNQD